MFTTNTPKSKDALERQFEQGSLRTKRTGLIAGIVLVVSFFYIDWAPVAFSVAFVCILFWLLLVGVSPEKLSLPVRLWNLWRFLWDFIVDLIKSNIAVFQDVLSPKNLHDCRMISVPIDDLTEMEVALLSHRITLTPGTLSCVIDEDARFLLVHCMFKKDSDDEVLSLRMPIDILKGKV